MKGAHFRRVALLSASGQETMAMEKSGSEVGTQALGDFEHAAYHQYLNQVANVPPGSIYASAVDLAKVGGGVMRPYVPLIVFVAPLFTADNQKAGLLVGEADISYILNSARLDSAARSEVIDATNGSFLLHADQQQLFGSLLGNGHSLYSESVNDAGPILAQLKDEGSLLNSKDHPNQFQVFARIHSAGYDNVNWVVLFGYPIADIMAPVTLARQLILLATLLSALLAAAFAFYVTRTITRPVSRLAYAAEALSRGQWGAPLPDLKTEGPTAPKEIMELAETFGHMRDELRDSRLKIEGYNARLEKTVEQRTKELMQERNATRNEKARIETIISSITDGVFVVTVAGDIVMMNPACRSLFGLGSGDFVGRPVEELALSFERLNGPALAKGDNPIRLAAAQTAVSSGDFYVVTPTARRPFAYRSAPIVSGGSVVGTVLVFRDIEEEVRIDRAKTEFVSTASHQLRTPLTAIRWYAEAIMNGDEGPMNDGIASNVSVIVESSRRMASLINTLLNVSRLETGRMRIAPEASDLQAIVREVWEENQPAVVAKSLTYAPSFAPGLPLINADRNLLKIVVQNLVGNAIRYSHAGGAIRVAIEREGESVTMAVEDSGIGIPAKLQDRVFTKMFRAPNAVVMEQDGNGLGLYIAKNIVDQSGGRIWFESVENEGTKFAFTLPIKGVPAKPGEQTLINVVK
jgi:PAS domain S-box-containing protein